MIAVVDDPPTIALFTSPHRLQLYQRVRQEAGARARHDRRRPDPPDRAWLAGRRDRPPDRPLRPETQHPARLDVSLVQLTHLAIKPDEFGLALIQERDRIGRLTPAGRWVWKHELRSPVEDLAIGPHGIRRGHDQRRAIADFRPRRRVRRRLHLRSDRPAPPDRGARGISPGRDLAEPRAGELNGCAATVSTARLSGIVRFPGRVGRSLALGRFALVTAADGRALTCDGSGTFLAQAAPSGDSNDVFGIDPAGEPIRISRRGVHLICAALDGQVRWRAVVDQPLGPLAAGTPGTAVILGKSLAWFRNDTEPRV